MDQAQIEEALRDHFVRTLRLDFDEDIPDAARFIAEQTAREIEVLTTERDNALLRVEALESAFGVTHTFMSRGGVNPNA